MITGFILQIFYTLVAFFIGLLPVIAIPSGWLNALTLIWSYVNQFNYLFPVQTLLTVLLFALAFHVALLLLSLAMWIIHLVRGR